MKYLIPTLITSILIFSAPAGAQDAAEEDTVVANATKRVDPALAAFFAGDFETAEIEFEKNAVCARRVERNFEAGLEAARDSSIQADVAGELNTAPQPSGGAGGNVSVPTTPAITPSFSVNTSGFEKENYTKKRTCADRGYQIYMMGMSQLQLGKTEEAKKAFSRATKIKRTLYDAHFRLSLLEYQAGNVDEAKKQFKSLTKIADRCKRCEAKKEIEGQVNYLTNLLGEPN